MPDALKARDAKDVEEAVRWALAENKALEVVGGGSKRVLGRPSQSDITLELSELRGVTLYEPEELVLSARAGTPIAELEELVRSSGQQLAFEPMDYGAVLGGTVGAGTIGGVLAANLSGPRRIKAGAARDHFLGFSAVSGRGETFKSGGRVVKNVTGYDLCKLLAGSFGTLAAMTEVTIKVLPQPETEATVTVLGLDDAAANRAMCEAMASSCDVSAAAHLPAGLIMYFDGLHVMQAATAFRIEGFAPSVRHRKAALTSLLQPYGPVEQVDDGHSRALWRSIRDARPFSASAPTADRPLWRVSTAPARGHELTAMLSPDTQWFYDWAGGLVWIAASASDDGDAAAIRRAARAVGGHATLIRAPAALRAAVDVFEPQPAALAAVTRRVKESFDPKGVLNPGRMWAGGVMQTNFSLAQLAAPDTAEADKILRACVHCGFCNATCPTYVLLGDELDSPRGRIYLIKDMLEHERPATEEVVRHIDRCLSCLACMTTCPSGVHYMHLVDHARAHIEATYRRPLLDRLVREFLAHVMPYPSRLRLAMVAALFGRPFAPLLAAIGLAPLAAAIRLAPGRAPGPFTQPGVHPANGARRARVAVLAGCANEALSPSITQATIRVLNRHGVEAVIAPGEGCCGSLAHHMGREHDALDFARANVDAWTREIEAQGLDAILITISGCGTTVKDYGFMLRTDPAYAAKAAKVSALARDVSEYLATLGIGSPAGRSALTVAFHSPCSLQHGQRVHREPKELLTACGFAVREVPEAHLCCGSAGTYNILQPEIARRLRDRKIANIERTKPDVIAAGNIGCITQIAAGTAIPVVHPVELIDWATGGPVPEPLRERLGR